MTAYEDLSYELNAEDDTQEVTCRMCSTDCPLSFIQDGCCPSCASLIASNPIVKEVDAITRRAHLVSLTRKAFVKWGEATDLLNARQTALRPSQACIEEAALHTFHLFRRYNRLESALADETGLTKFSVYNDIVEFPACSRLLTSNL